MVYLKLRMDRVKGQRDMKSRHRFLTKVISLFLIGSFLFSFPPSLFADSLTSHLRAQSAVQDGSTKRLLLDAIQGGSVGRSITHFVIAAFLSNPWVVSTVTITGTGILLACVSCEKLPTKPRFRDILPSDIKYTIEEATSMGQRFVRGQVTASGLVQSLEGDPSSFLSDNGEALSYLVTIWDDDLENQRKARLIGEALERLQKVAPDPQKNEGSWADVYNTDGGAIDESRTIGAQAVAAQGLVDLFEKTGDTKYLFAAIRSFNFILNFQSPQESPLFGSIQGGLDAKGEKILWTSTADNARALMLFYRLSKVGPPDERYAERLIWIANWLTQKMWNADHFEAGLVDTSGNIDYGNPEKTDAQSLPVIAFDLAKELLVLVGIDPASYNPLPWLSQYITTVEYKLPTEEGIIKKIFDGIYLHGFSIKTQDRSSFGSEVTARVIEAAQALGNLSIANQFLPYLRVIQQPNGGIPRIIGTGGGEYPHHDPRLGVRATVDFVTVLKNLPKVAQDGSLKRDKEETVQSLISRAQSHNPAASVLQDLLDPNKGFLRLAVTTSLLKDPTTQKELEIAAMLFDQRNFTGAILLVDPTPKTVESHEIVLREKASRHRSLLLLTPEEAVKIFSELKGEPFVRIALETDKKALGGEVDHIVILPEDGKVISFLGLLQLASFHDPNALKAFPKAVVKAATVEISPQLNRLRPEVIETLFQNITANIVSIDASFSYQETLQDLLLKFL